MSEGVILSVNGLSQSFTSGKRRVRALSGVSFDIMRAEIFGLVGESGSGKSTMGRIISGIYEPSGGTVSFSGEIIRAGSADAKSRVKAKKREARRRAFKLSLDMAMHPYRASELEKEINNVNVDLQKTIKTASEEIRLAREVGRKWGKRAHPGIRMVFQDPSASLNPRMTVGEAIGEALLAIGVRDKNEIDRRVKEALRVVGLAPSSLSRYPSEFSGGQRQRVGIARAIITSPELLIADEPISALDASVGAQVVNLLRSLAREMSLSVLFIAHDLSVVRHICDRVGVMYKGHLVELGRTEDIYTDARHPYTRALLAAAPVPDPRAARVRRATPEIEISTAGRLVDVGGGHLVLCEEEK